MKTSPIISTIDFNIDGIQHGHLKVPYSGDDSAWGAVMIPITMIKRGEGATALLTGGNHGDEYEGPIALWSLFSQIELAEITGRIIIVPAMNYPAFTAAKRTSGIDGGNMNRVFPGKPDGSITEVVADYFNRTLLPMADYVLDIHAGGKTLDFVPFAAAHVLEDKELQGRCVAAMQAFNAPYSMMLLELDAASMYDTAAESQGKVFVSTELGGGGSATASSVVIAKRGVKNFLRHTKILAGDVKLSTSTILDMPDARCFITCEHAGLLEMCVDLGQVVGEGEVIARIYNIERTGEEPIEYRTQISGVLAGRHFPGLIKHGDNLAVVAVKLD